jgi:hypothetical protein
MLFWTKLSKMQKYATKKKIWFQIVYMVRVSFIQGAECNDGKLNGQAQNIH